MKKVIYTLWTKPLIIEKKLYNNILFLLLSIHLMKKQSREIIIYTDTFGEMILKKFNLDVEINNIVINQFNNLDVKKWSIPKLYTINAQKEPFLHIDHDVLIWDTINYTNLNNNNCDILLQNEEVGGLFPLMYKLSFLRYFRNNENIPADLLDCLDDNQYFGGYNCGYLDINNIEISKKWSNFAIDIANSFVNNFIWDDCILVEQFSLFFLSKKYNFNIGTITQVDYLSETSANFEYKPKTDFRYTHIMREKRNPIMVSKIEKILENFNPEMHIILKNNEYFLLKDSSNK
jgi:hypothetical protein